MIFILNLLQFVTAEWLPKQTFVVQTADNCLHFVNSTIETHSLQLDQTVKMIESGDAHEDRTAVARASTKVNDGSVKKAGRIDHIFITESGTVDFFGRKIFIEDILLHPIIENGIYIAASQEHIPEVIKNTVVITAATKLYVLDLYGYTSKTLRFNQLLYLQETYMNIPKKDNQIYLNRRWWSFDSKITAVYVLKEKDGLNFMFRVLSKSEVAVYRQKASKNTHKRTPFLMGMFLIFASILYFNRNLRFESCILKKRLYTGRFVKNECLVYRVSNSFLARHRKIYGNLKHNRLVHILNESEGFFYPAIVTERTFQFVSPCERRKIDELLQDRPQSSSETSESELTTKNTAKEQEISYKTYADYFNAKIYDESQQVEKGKFRGDLYSIIEGIEYLHTQGIIHGRICPENLRINDHGDIRIQNLFENHGWRSVKQLRNIKNKEYVPDTTDDMFSLGCTIHYYLTGYHPFDMREIGKRDKRPSKKANEDFIKEQEKLESNNTILEIAPASPKPPNRYLSVLTSLKNFYLSLFAKVSSALVNFYIWRLESSWLHRLFVKILRKKTSINAWQIYHRIQSEEVAKYIEYNTLYNTYKIRLTDQVEHDLVYHCIKSPVTQTKIRLTSHPYFWNDTKSLEFICDVSDFIETFSNFKSRLERSKRVVFSGSWTDYLDASMVKSICAKRTYDHQSICDLVRFIRNCHRHYQELRSNELFENLDGKLFNYLSHIFPELLMFLYRSPVFKEQLVLKKYYE